MRLSLREELHEKPVIDRFHIGIFALHADLNALGGPDTDACGLHFLQYNAAGAEPEDIYAFFRHILLPAEKCRGTLQGYTPDRFFRHVSHLCFYHTGNRSQKKEGKPRKERQRAESELIFPVLSSRMKPRDRPLKLTRWDGTYYAEKAVY